MLSLMLCQPDFRSKRFLTGLALERLLSGVLAHVLGQLVIRLVRLATLLANFWNPRLSLGFLLLLDLAQVVHVFSRIRRQIGG